MAAPEGDARHSGTSSKSEGLGGELTGGDGSVAVGDLVEAATVAGVAPRDIEAATKRGTAWDGSVRAGTAGVKDGVGLGVAAAAGSALEPDDVAAGVEHHVGVPRGRANPDPSEVLAAALGKSGHHLTTEPPSAGHVRSRRRRRHCEDLRECLDSSSVTVEAEAEDLLRGGGVSQEGVTVGKVDMERRGRGRGRGESRLRFHCRGEVFVVVGVLREEGFGAREGVDNEGLVR